MPRTRLERFGFVGRTYGRWTRTNNVSIWSDSSDSDSYSTQFSSADSSEPSREHEQSSDSDNNDQNSVSNENDDDSHQSNDSEEEGEEDANSDNENDNQSDDTESVMSRESRRSNDSNNSHRRTGRILDSPSPLIDSDSNSNSSSARSETSRRSRNVGLNSESGSDLDNDDGDDFTMEFSHRRSRSRSNSSSSRNSLEEEVFSSMEDNDSLLSMSFRPLRLPLPGTPSPSPPPRSSSTSSSSSNSSVANDSPEQTLGEFFNRLAQAQQQPNAPLFHPVPHSYGMAEPRPSTTETGTVSFECCVCLENLDAPASLDDFPGRNVPDVVPNTVGPSFLAGRRSTQLANGSILKDTDVVATHCGHLYHQVCLEKWFLEQGKRTCPSCRKSVPKSKVIRIYPNLSTDSGGPGSPTPGTSSSSGSGRQASGSANSNPGGSSSSKVNQPNGGEGDGNNCGQMECQDLKVLHATLMNDYTELQTRYETLRENDELKEAQILSLEEDNARKSREIERLKRGSEETQAGTSSSSDRSSLYSAKRRRY